MRTVNLSQGMNAIVDENVYEWLMQWKWHAQKGGQNLYYACRNSKPDSNGKRTQLRMHREVLSFNGVQIPENLKIDHIDQNGLNNVLANLRLVSHQQNIFNQRGSFSKTSSIFKGVFPWQGKENRFTAQINTSLLDRKGYFSTEYEAAKAYDCWIYSIAGDTAYLNFPDEPLWTEDQVESVQCKQKRASSGYIGVGRNRNNKYTEYWIARIYHNGKTLTIGDKFSTPEEAALAYNEAAVRLKGDKAKLNIIATP